MSDTGEEDQETYLGRVTKQEQRVYIKIKCLRGNTVSIILLIYVKHAAMIR